jgi:gliding motility-associated-like protein
MKKILSHNFTEYLFIILFFTTSIQLTAQCGIINACNPNAGLFSNDIANDIAYDNMGSSFHSSYIVEANNVWKVWGERMYDGLNHAFEPRIINNINYPALTGTIYKMAIGSAYAGSVQLIILTSTGLFVMGTQNTVVSYSLATNWELTKITVNGKLDGLPTGISPEDVKMMFASAGTLIITSCDGRVFVLSKSSAVRGNGGIGNALQWSQVMIDANTPLTDVIVTRGQENKAFALRNDGTIWTWGAFTYLGNGTNSSTIRNFATQMILPSELTSIKMIQMTGRNNSTSYYILGTNQKIYALGNNNKRELGDNTSVNRTTWVNAKLTDDTIIEDAKWISANEHDNNYSSISVIRQGGLFYTAGDNNGYMIGRPQQYAPNSLEIPIGISASDVITFSEVGGHTTAVVKEGSPRYGYVGHYVNGSLGDGTDNSEYLQSFNFIIPPIVNICGSNCLPPLITSNSPICPNETGIINLQGVNGDIIQYTINNGPIQTITIDNTGIATIVLPSIQTNQNLNFTQLNNGLSSCSIPLNIQLTVEVSPNATLPIFNQIPTICSGDSLSQLPLISNNGITGTWSPNLNNITTTTYTFTPNEGQCANFATMTITVEPVIIPTFNQVIGICVGEFLSPLPTTSNEGIIGSWSPVINNTQTTTYIFTPDAGQCSSTQTMTIYVNTATIPTFDQVQDICIGQTLSNLPTISTNNITGNWFPPINNTQTTNYTFIPDAGQCASNTSMTINVNPLTFPTFNQVEPICEGSNLEALPSLSNEGISGTWTPEINNLETTTYNFIPFEGQCATNQLMTIEVIPRFTPIFETVQPQCYLADFNLPNISLNNISGSWSPNFNNTVSGNYIFTPTNTCDFPISIEVTIRPDFDFEVIRYCKNQNFILEVIPLNQSFSISNVTYNWSYDENIILNNNLPILDVSNYLVSSGFYNQKPYTITISVTNEFGCEKVKEIIVDNDYCKIQKGISPNGDNLNDFFDLRLLNVKQLMIFNRYGVKVYEKYNYKDEWTGQTNDGKILPDGTYYYIIYFNENIPFKTGWIYINKERN